VKDYARTIAPDKVCIWEYAYDLLTSLEKKCAIDFLFLLSRADPPSFREAAQSSSPRCRSVISIAPKPDRREQARQAAFEWMRAVLQKEISPRRASPGDRRCPDITALLTASTMAACPIGTIHGRSASPPWLERRHGCATFLDR